jgi:hypothetical protein
MKNTIVISAAVFCVFFLSSCASKPPKVDHVGFMTVDKGQIVVDFVIDGKFTKQLRTNLDQDPGMAWREGYDSTRECMGHD